MAEQWRSTGSNEPLTGPDERGHFGPYGGRFVAETLMFALDELESTYRLLSSDAEFRRVLEADLRTVGVTEPTG